MIAALIPAAGDGMRLGQGPKALLEVAGKTLLERAVAAFLGQVAEVVVAVSASMIPRATRLLAGQARLIEGGATRQQSVMNLLMATDAELVLIHDAARPFLSRDVVTRVIGAVEAYGAASAVMPVADTLIEAASGRALDRSLLRAVQTPQGFRRTLILEAHRQALAAGVVATDDAGLVRWLGQPVALVAGSPWLMKITTPDDLVMAQALAEAWDGT
ncbi:MAG: 2-C-methyl-D-erythritol 4-phosphate cytidylyltransferase [Truepera sp.]|nr:2-C-methyl-D-erythritol 4-phosphate cytidylyltransferase [Truepera sp.]